jgi:hypothetical protein
MIVAEGFGLVWRQAPRFNNYAGTRPHPTRETR